LLPVSTLFTHAFAALAAAALAGQDAPRQPPAGSPPVVRVIEIAFPNQGNVSLVDPQTYLYYIHTRPSRPSVDEWAPFDPQIVLEDFRRLWATGFLENLSIDVRDVPYDNGVVGKHIVFNLEERQRVKIVDYVGAKSIETAKIDERLKEASAQIRLDSFIDAGLVRKAEGIVRGMLNEKGFQDASVTHEIQPMPGGPKLVHLTFHLDEGPRVRIRKVLIAGNREIRDRALRGALKTNRQKPWWRPSFLGGSSTYQQALFDEDADRMLQYYRDRGYITAHIGTPEIIDVALEDRGRTRTIDLRIPVQEGSRYRVGGVTFEGNVALDTESLAPWFRVKSGAYYGESAVRKGYERARELYGARGYFEFSGYPDLKPHDAEPIVDVTLRIAEGKQYFVNRITFAGNTTTHDAVVRRELALLEGGVFNTEALKYSVRRLNQLGYFKPIEDQKNVKVDKAQDAEDRVDITLKLEEQNRNQVNFGAGVSEYEGVFGTLSYTTANFLGRGESLTLSAQKGSRATLYQIALTEPYLFERPISGSVDLYSRKYNYFTSATQVAYSEVRQGSSWSIGRPVRRFSRAFLNYTYEVIDVDISEELLKATTSGSTAGAPLFNPSFDKGRHVDSRVAPTLVHNTIDNPIMPHRGRRLTASVQVAGQWLRGSYDYLKPDLEAVFFLPTSRRTGVGVRGEAGLLHTYGSTTEVPYYLRYFLGGEYQIRGVDIRTVGPLDSSNRALGGTKYLLFNAEYYFDIAGPVRLLAFHDAGQAFDETHPFDLRQLRTSSGGEVRVFMPVLNVPFRLIYYVNVYRDTFQPARGFKFAVGTTF
jgi:outer membrane protein insertion porin family